MKQKNKKTLWIIIAVIVVVFMAITCVFAFTRRKGNDTNTKGDGIKSGSDEEEVITAMYVPYGDKEDQYVMIDQDRGTVFTVTMPDEIYDSHGDKIKEEKLEKGNILDIYGNGIMLQSYPGQYPGVTKIEVKEKGKPSDADQYQNIIDEIYQEPDPAEPPSLSLEYKDEDSQVSAAATRGGYEWNYEDENGDAQSAIGDTSPILTWDEINELDLAGKTNVTLTFTEEPDSVDVNRLNPLMRDSEENADDEPEGEEVKAEKDGDHYVLKDVEPGFVYQVTAHWDNSYVEYGFSTEVTE